MDECQPLPRVPATRCRSNASTLAAVSATEVVDCTASAQGLTLVHFSAQRKRFLLDKGCSGVVK